MLNLHLITKISKKDQSFRKNILQMVAVRATEVIADSEEAKSNEDWNKCYFILKKYLSSIQPYCQLTYLNSLKKKLDNLKDSKKDHLKKDVYQNIIGSIKTSLVSLGSGPDKGASGLSSNQPLKLKG